MKLEIVSYIHSLEELTVQFRVLYIVLSVNLINENSIIIAFTYLMGYVSRFLPIGPKKMKSKNLLVHKFKLIISPDVHSAYTLGRYSVLDIYFF